MCFLLAISDLTKSCSVVDVAGAPSCLSCTFCREQWDQLRCAGFVLFVDLADLDVASHVTLDRCESYGAEDVCDMIVRLRLGCCWADDLFSPKRPVSDSAACRKSVVLMALPLAASTGTSVKFFLMVSKKLPPGGYVSVADIVSVYLSGECIQIVYRRRDEDANGL